MAGFVKKKYGLIVALVALLSGLPFVHYHPEYTHTHQSEFPSHHHEGHFHSHELSGFVSLIDYDSANPGTSEGNHSHPDTDTGATYFEVNLQQSNSNPVKVFKVVKFGNVQRLFLISGPAVFHSVSLDSLAFHSPVLADPRKERSPPSLSV